MATSCKLPFVTSLALALCAATAAQETPTDGVYVPAKPVIRINPDYPMNALTQGREGWVTMSFVVSPAGQVIEPMIVESSHEVFEDVALDAIRRWRYEPASRGGEPVEESVVQTTIRFMIRGATGASKTFRRSYEEIVGLLQAKDLAGALAKLDELESKGRLNFYEDAWFWFAKSLYLEVAQSPDVDARLQALQRAVGVDEVNLAPELFVAAMQRLYVLHAQRGEIGAAASTFERLRDLREVRKSENYAATLAAMQPSYDVIMAAVAGDQPIAVPAKIDEHNYWIDKLLRRSFAIDSVVGRVDVVDIRCKVGTGRFGFTDEDRFWTVPASWEDCRVYIKGEPGTTFRLIEYPDAATPAAVSRP